MKVNREYYISMLKVGYGWIISILSICIFTSRLSRHVIEAKNMINLVMIMNDILKVLYDAKTVKEIEMNFSAHFVD